MPSVADKATVADWAARVRVAASWVSGPRAAKLNDLAEEMEASSAPTRSSAPVPPTPPDPKLVPPVDLGDQLP